MAIAVVMPKAGISVESCIMGTWRVKVGDIVAVGDILFDYETDKASFECESTAEGAVLGLFFESGDEVECLTNVCAIGNAGDDVGHLRPGGASVTQAVPAVINVSENTPKIEAVSAIANTESIGLVSPRAKNLASQMKIDISAATPSGPRGRIIERDIIAASNIKTGGAIGGRNDDGFISSAKQPEVIEKTAAIDIKSEYTDEKMSQIRKVIAKSMTKSLTEMAQLTNHHSCDATAMLKLRRRFKSNGADMKLDGVSINDLVLFAVVKTLLAHPDINAYLLNSNTLRRFSGVHLGMAVDTPRGLMVPTIFNADKLSLAQLSAASKDLASQAKSGKISPDLLTGASFTVSNLGALGVEMFTPVINPPQVAILGVCGLTTKVRETNGSIEAYQSLGLSLTYDHRCIDGAPASRFAQDLAKNLENIDLLLAL